jgi:hypothetical protein
MTKAHFAWNGSGVGEGAFIRVDSRFASVFRQIVFFIGALLLPLAATAHPMGLTAARVTIRPDGHYELNLTFDVLAFVVDETPMRVSDDAMNALLDGSTAELERQVSEARTRFMQNFAVIADGRELPPAEMQFPTAADILTSKASGKAPRLPVMRVMTARGRLASVTHTIQFRFPDVLGDVVLTTEAPGEEPESEPVTAGEASSEWTIKLTPTAAPSSRQSAVAGSAGASLGTGTGLAHGATATVAGKETSSVQPKAHRGFFVAVAGFVRLGFTHIVPEGLDHMLFVIGLFLLAGRLSALLWQVTAFTVAHSITLGFSLYGAIQLPASVVEPLISLSIVLVALDNLRGGELRWWRVLVVFGFGLIHGLGFAGALRDLALPREEFLRALFGFNIGVELGQLAVIAIAFLAVGWFRRKPYYRRWIVTPASIAIAAVAVIWTAQRLWL